ncbi:MAG: hypothetical protein GY749_50835 [Desulfobacteraceae bacterium]|nr:hypothetical protein [Desulfobacteraceae bacterium]
MSMSRQEVIDTISQFSEDQLQKAISYITLILHEGEQEKNSAIDEQQELLELLNYTVNTGRGDFAEKHDHYLYEMPE